MKYLIKFFILILFILNSRISLFAGITGSPHDFSVAHVTGANGEVCSICHVPHNSLSTELPLWRTNLSRINNYVLYSSDTLDATVNQPLAPTKACLTCHDGSSASSAANGCSRCHQKSSLGTNLSNDHPVSFLFDTALTQQDTALKDPATTPVAALGGKMIRQGMLYQDRMECSSCHDVHAAKGDSATAPHQLLVNNQDDKLCLTCHIK